MRGAASTSNGDKEVDPKALAISLGFTATPIRTLETGCEIDVCFVDDTTAEVGLNNYVYTPKKHVFAPDNVHSHPKQGETQRRLTAIEAACLIDGAS